MQDIPLPAIGCTCFALRKLTRTVSRLYDQHMATVGLKTTQYSLLRCVEREALPIAALAMRLSAERTTLTRNIKPLMEAGWIEIKPGADSRQRIVTITDAGRDTIKIAKQAWRRAQTELEDALGMETVRALHGHLDTALVKITPLVGELATAEEE